MSSQRGFTVWRRYVSCIVLLLSCINLRKTNAVIVPAHPVPVEVRPSVAPTIIPQPRVIDQPEADSSLFRLPCGSEKPFVFGRSSTSQQLYLLDGVGLYRMESEEKEGFVKSLVSTLPQRYEEARMLQVLDIQLGGTDHVLFVVTTDQWHNVFLAVRNPSAGTAATAQPIQRIKYTGSFSKARLLECNGSIYLVTIVTYTTTGKIRVYRWQQSYFSLESTKEMPSIDDVRCHCPSTLLLMVLDYSPMPERSLNHVLLLDSAERPVKVQEMFFLYSTLPSFTLDGELYLIRHVSKDKSYLYQWSSEAKFVRLRNLPYHPQKITTYTHWDSTLAVAFDDQVRLYGSDRQSLLRIEASFTVQGANASESMTQLKPGLAGDRMKRLYGLRSSSSEELTLATEFYCPELVVPNTTATALHIYKLTIRSTARTASESAQEQGFRTLNTCLYRLKQELNERKKWIDLIRLQLSRKNLLLDSIVQDAPGTRTLLHPTVQVNRLLLPHDDPNVLPPSRTALNGQSLLVRHYRVATDLNQVLLLNRARTEIRGDLHVTGNVRTRCTKIRAIKAQDGSEGGLSNRKVRQTPSIHHRRYRVVNAKEIVSDSTLSKRFLQRSKMNVVKGTVQVDELHADTVRVEHGHINHIAIPSRKVLEDGAKHGYGGHKVFRNVKSFRLHAQHLNGQPLSTQIIESGLKYANDGITIKTDLCRTRNLVVRDTINGVRLRQLVSSYERTMHVKGNVVLAGPVCVKNLQFQRTLNEVPKEELLDRLSNQTITGPMFVSKGFTHSLQVQRVNGEQLTNYATTAATNLLVKAPVRAEKTVILGDLIANHEQQQFAPHIGTRPGDFRQLYTGKVLLNGSLRLKVAHIHAPNVTIMGESVSSKPYHRYLLRTERQILNDPVTYGTAQFQYLFANTLNGVAVWQFSLVHRNWQNSLYMQDVTVQGHIRPTRIAKRLHTLQQDRVDLKAHVRVCDVKHFTGTLRVANLYTHSLDGSLSPDGLWRKGTPYGVGAPKALQGRTELHHSLLHVRGALHTGVFNGRTAYELTEIAKPPRRRCRTLRLHGVNATTASVRQVAGLSLVDVLHRFTGNGGTHRGSVGTGHVPSFAKIITTGRTQPIAVASIGTINFCPVQRLLQDTVHKFAPGRPIAGYKRVLGAMSVPRQLSVGRINDHGTDQLGRIVTRDPDALPQTIDARWKFGSLAAGFLTAKLLNRVPLDRLAIRTDETLVLQGELLIERLLVTALLLPTRPHWILEPNKVRVAHDVARLRCHGSIHGQVRDPGHPLHQLLLAPSLDRTRIVAGGVVFAGESVHFGNGTTATATGAMQRVERIARRCLRRGPAAPPVAIFEHEQVLTGVEMVPVRGNLHIADAGHLHTRAVNGVNIGERLGPGADLYLLGAAHKHRHDAPIVGEKRWAAGLAATARNVTLIPTATGTNFWTRLAHCTVHSCPLTLHFAQPIAVTALLTADKLNHVPLDGFFHAFAKRRPSANHQTKLRHIQDFPGTLTVTELQLAGAETIIPHVNGIPLGECVLRTTTNASHQTIPGAKTFRALHIDGPLSLQLLNGRRLAQIRRSALSPEAVHHLEAAIFNRPVVLGGLYTRTLYHGPTSSARLADATQTVLLPPELHPGAMQHPRSVLRARTPQPARSRAAPADGPLTLGDTRIRLHCSPDHRSLVVELSRQPSNRTSEQRLHELSRSAGCFKVTGAVVLNRTALLLVVLAPDTSATAHQYDVARGHLMPVPFPSSGSTGRFVALLRPTADETMLAGAVHGDPTPASTSSTSVRIYRLDRATLRHFQTIALAAPIAGLATTPDGGTLLVQDNTKHWHRYTYNSVQGWTTRDDE
uniref:VWFD domain-containing protein n=1 Tax=Anopheles farauti TaxID=69004 RepID=A0A182QL25_9DIPT